MENWTHNKITESELKELVRDVYDCKIFTSLHLKNQDHLLMSIFMPLMFLGAAPTEPSFPEQTGNIRKDRKNKLNHFDKIDEWKKDLQKWEDDKEIREDYMKNIGMLYEQNSKAGPTSINGYSIFFSCVIVSREDTKRFIEMYNKYVKMREEFENEWK